MAIMGKRELKYSKIRKAMPTGLYIYYANIFVYRKNNILYSFKYK